MPCDSCGQCEECGTRLYQAGERVPPGTYLRVDDGSFQPVSLLDGEVAPASFDGHIAFYRAAAGPCACERLQRGAPDAMGASVTEQLTTSQSE